MKNIAQEIVNMVGGLDRAKCIINNYPDGYIRCIKMTESTPTTTIPISLIKWAVNVLEKPEEN